MKKTAILLAAFLMSPVLTANQRTLSDVIREHLSYLGYTSTRDGNTISAKHHIKPGFDILVVSNGILFRAWFAHKKMDDARLGEYVAVVNRLNESTTIGKFYVDRDHDLIV
ncbi:MAG: YbjN domain-containing protein, partial [Spirochaetota bacterium]